MSKTLANALAFVAIAALVVGSFVAGLFIPAGLAGLLGSVMAVMAAMAALTRKGAMPVSIGLAAAAGLVAATGLDVWSVLAAAAVAVWAASFAVENHHIRNRT